MALADYRLCDVCDSRVFYDANLNYEQGTSEWGNEPIPKEEEARIAGEAASWGYRLDYLGDWAVICRDCAKTHKTVVVPFESASGESDPSGTRGEDEPEGTRA